METQIKKINHELNKGKRVIQSTENLSNVQENVIN